jgi:hypothetical protein
MHCPYPTPEAGARALRCGKYWFGCDGPATTLHVIGFDVADEETVVEELDAIAAEGGTERARYASDAAGLRHELMDLFDSLTP